MSDPGGSWKKVQYDLRSAKQAERRMLIDAFHLLSLAAFPIRDYKYVGMGSIYFVDFILLHRLLGINRMLSVEVSKIPKRLSFNRPFDCIDIEIGNIGDCIPRLSRDIQHILWLDYDGVFSAEYSQDIILACTYLSRGSILLITVDTEAPGSDKDGPKQWREHFVTEANNYLPPQTASTFAESNLPRVNIQVIQNVIKSGMASRPDVGFIPLFNFLYADGHRMLTLGGMIGGPEEVRKIQASHLPSAGYARLDLNADPYEIRVPRLTRRERMLLDSAMPCKRGWKPKDLEIPPEDVAAYADVYRFLPAYAELLL